jgi:hypothetical protein
MRLTRGVLAVAAAAWTLGLFVRADAQTIRIPDFRNERPAAATGPGAGEKCERCGVITSIRQVQARRPVPVPPSLQTNPVDQGPGSSVLVGAVIALPTGEGPGNQPYVGGVGTPEMRERFTETSYEMGIRLDTGGYTQVTRQDGGRYRVGDRVRVMGTQLELLAP